jgi:hypothetical protein
MNKKTGETGQIQVNEVAWVRSMYTSGQDHRDFLRYTQLAASRSVILGPTELRCRAVHKRGRGKRADIEHLYGTFGAILRCSPLRCHLRHPRDRDVERRSC